MTVRPTIVWAAACILATASASLEAQGQAPKPVESRAAPRSPELVSSTISGFNIVLVVGETQASGSTSADDLPAAARKALNDMREFLPYKHYRVLDVQWTSCCGPRNTTISGRLQGVAGVPGPNGSVNLQARGYGFLIVTSASQQHLPIRFVLNPEEPGGRGGHADSLEGARAAERERQDLRAEIMTLELQIQKMRQQMEVGLTSANDLDLRRLVDQHASLRRRLADMEHETTQAGSTAGRSIMDSSFTMDAGETVVVGTSRLGGDKALIAVVSAVRKSPGKRE